MHVPGGMCVASGGGTVEGGADSSEKTRVNCRAQLVLVCEREMQPLAEETGQCGGGRGGARTGGGS